jgi:hypothetical protein
MVRRLTHPLTATMVCCGLSVPVEKMFVGIVLQRVRRVEPQAVEAVVAQSHQSIVDQKLTDEAAFVALQIDGGPQPVVCRSVKTGSA